MASRLIDKLLVTYKDIEYFKKVTVINAQNVEDYLHPQRETRSLDKEYSTLPCIAPPFDYTFIEFKADDDPKRQGEDYQGAISCGLYVQSARVKEDTHEWNLFIVYFVDTLPMANVNVWLDTEGRWNGMDDPTPMLPEHPQLTHKEMRESMFTIVPIALWTFAFMNCKNATLEAVEPNAAENKRRAKHGKLPLMRYHVLKIKPFGSRSDNEAQGGTHGSPALHIRRGHFKTYTDAAPLFGSLVGTYWWEQSIAGKKSNRVVVKDYEMDLTGAK